MLFKIINKIKLCKIKWKKSGKKRIGNGFKIIGSEFISLGDLFYAEENLKLQAWKSYKGQKFTPSIDIGKEVSMMDNCQVSCCSTVRIGDGCLFGPNVFVTDNFHGNNSLVQVDIPPIDRTLEIKGAVYIGKNVWIGRNVCVMPGVTIGDGAVIGANAVVTHNIPPKCIAVGAPAKVTRQIE